MRSIYFTIVHIFPVHINFQSKDIIILSQFLLQNSELFTLTYGALVSQLLKDYENVDDVNKQLERMGYNIGIRLIEDFLARTSSGRCYDFRDTADKIQVRQEKTF